MDFCDEVVHQVVIHLGDVDMSHIGKQVVIEFEFAVVEHLLDQLPREICICWVVWNLSEMRGMTEHQHPCTSYVQGYDLRTNPLQIPLHH